MTTRQNLNYALFAAMFSVPTAAIANVADLSTVPEARINLKQAIDVAEKHQGGQAIDASLEDDGPQLTYEVSVLKDNRVFDVLVDAVSGKVINTQEDMDD